MKQTTALGTYADDTAKARAAQSAPYRVEQEQLALWAEIAAQVILARTRAGLTQEDLAQKLHTSVATISRLERGQHAVSEKTRRRVSDALGLRRVVGEADTHSEGNTDEGQPREEQRN